jgi:hypothetical protein
MMEIGNSIGMAADEVRNFGSTVLRQAWPLEKLSRIREAIESYEISRNKEIAAGETEGSIRMLASHGVGALNSLFHNALLKPSQMADLFSGSRFHQICKELLGDEAYLIDARRVGFRIHKPDVSTKSFIPYHQDSYTQDERITRILKCWIPLHDKAGSECPGLEVVRNICWPSFPRKDFGLRSENAAYDFITIDRDDIVSEYGKNFVAPKFELGDGFIFSENVIHRTYVSPEMKKPRMNFELRIFSQSCLADGYSISDIGRTVYRVA